MASNGLDAVEEPFFSKIFENEDCETALSLLEDQSEVTGSRKRKHFRPQRSLPVHDPYFRGAYVSMKTIVENKANLRLEMSCYFKLTSDRRYRRHFKHHQMRRAHFSDSASRNSIDSVIDEEGAIQNVQPESVIINEKHCASCSVKKTPLWRDAEDGTPLCNACGIRYKKYKIRCTRCWHIPKKDEFSPTCKFCGSGFQFAVPRNFLI